MEAARGVQEKTLEWHEVARDGRRGDRKSVDVRVPAGVDSGMQIRLSGKGGQGDPGAPSGDLFVQIEVEPDSYFERDGPDISSNNQGLMKRGTRLFRAKMEMHKTQINEGIGTAPLFTNSLADNQALLIVIVGSRVVALTVC